MARTSGTWTKETARPGPGRPKGRVTADVKALAREYGPESLERLAKWMRSDHPTASPLAARELLDRGFGKSIQRNEHTGADGGPIKSQDVNDERPPVETFLAEFQGEQLETKH